MYYLSPNLGAAESSIVLAQRAVRDERWISAAMWAVSAGRVAADTILEARGVSCSVFDIGDRLGQVRPGFPGQCELEHEACELDRLRELVQVAAGIGFPTWIVSPCSARDAVHTAERLLAVANSMGVGTRDPRHPF